MPVKYWTVNELVIIVWNRMNLESDPQVKHHLAAAYSSLKAAHMITDPELYGGTVASDVR